MQQNLTTNARSTTGADTSNLTKKVDLASLNLKSNEDKLDIDKFKYVSTNVSNMKSKADKLDVDKLVPVAPDLSKLSDTVEKDVSKKNIYIYIHIYKNAKVKNIEDKIPDISNLATNTTFNDKINEIKNKIPSVINLATTTALNANIKEV